MNLNVQPHHLLQAANAIGAISNPKGTALSFLGLSEDEQKAGIPAWAWATLALAAGVYIGVKVKPKIKEIL